MVDLRETTRTARTYVLSRGMGPAEAWDEAAKKAGKKAKGYPRSTFLALAEAGLVKGIPPGPYLERGGDVREYAVRMIELLVADDDYEDDPEELFSVATKGRNPEGGQIDVVFALWNHGLIDTSKVQEPAEWP